MGELEDEGIDLPDHDRSEEGWNYEAPSKKKVSFRAPKPLLEEVEALVEAGVFHNRAEAMRAGLREVVFGDYELASEDS